MADIKVFISSAHREFERERRQLYDYIRTDCPMDSPYRNREMYIHSSQRTPIIAHPLFLAGYIEHLGTGTTDMNAYCQEYSLRAPDG